MFRKLNLLLLFYFLQAVYSARILGLFTNSILSHQLSYDPLMIALAKRGHNVTVATFFPLQNKLTNYHEVNLQNLSNLRVEVFDIRRYEQPVGIMRVPFVSSVLDQVNQFENMAGIVLDICEKLLRYTPFTALIKNEYDVVITGHFIGNCVLKLLEVHNVTAPVIGICASTILPWTNEIMGAESNPSFVPVKVSSFTSKMTFIQRLENTIVYILMTTMQQRLIEQEKTMIEKYYSRKTKERNNFNLILLNSHHVLNGIRPLVPGLIEIGGIHVDSTVNTLPKHIEKFINESVNGVIVFSLGAQTKSTSLSKKKQNILINVFSKLKQRIIWKYAESAEEGTIIGNNILRVKWIPQKDVLHQRLNAVAAKEAGVAEVLSLPDFDEEDLEKAIENVLSQGMQEKAKEVSQIWHDRENTPLHTAVYWTERVIRWGHKSPLHSPSRDMPLYQYLLLDVLVFIVLFVSTIIFCLVFMSNWIILKMKRLINSNIKTKFQ
ncbi:UDP-glycosyltransferase UGT5-like isoform X2 [Leptidea sinapis]|uniref:UDP-glycosyltransferase UGT5-like isoform X2 n=1 Tax=Leptidea sinapis TaxID=189913 RepID=UPI00213EA3F4|nr:UDP-glycosyltransferase UGT5-like isoform X2 [Leptidea sinapis]